MSDDKLTLEQVQQAYGQMPTFKEFFYDWGGANKWLFETINSFHSSSYDAFMRFITQLGDHRFFMPYVLLLGVYALISMILKKMIGRGGTRQQLIMWSGVFLVLAAAFAIYGFISPGLKDYFQLPRPYVIIEGVVQLENREPQDAYRSFPSGHVVFFSLMVFSLWPMFSHHMKIFAGFMIALVGLSRVVLGVHFPADAVWGCAIGFVIVLCVRFVVYTLLRKVGLHCGGV